MIAIIDKLVFCTLFFSFAFIFRTNIMGYTVYYYQFFGIITLLLVFIRIVKEKIVLRKGYIKIINIVFMIVFVCASSFFFIQSPNNYSYDQYIKGLVSLIINYSIVITLFIYLSIEKDKNENKYFSFIKKVLQINIIYGIIQLIAYTMKIDLNYIIVNFLNLTVPDTTSKMGRFIRVSGFTWDANFYAYQLLFYIFLMLCLYKDKTYLKKYDTTLLFFCFILLFLTFSRSVILGLSIFLLVIVVTDIKKKYVHKTLAYIMLTTVILILIFIKFNETLMPIFWARFGFLVSNDYMTGSTLARMNFTTLGLKILTNNPFGIGYNNISSYALANYGYSFFKLHNSFLQLSAEAGIIAGFLFVLLLYNLIFFNNKLSIYKIAIFLAIIVINIFYDQALYLFNLIFLIIFTFIPERLE
jgi:hypothetical protein